MTNYSLPIHCIGDSHVSFFSGQDTIQPAWPEASHNTLPYFITYRLGAVLAYSLAKLETNMRGREKLFSILDQLPGQSTILLCFGEIDCRAHLLKQADLQNLDISAVIENCVETYTVVVKEIRNLNFNVVVWNATPSFPPGTANDPDYPAYGSCRARNQVTKLFNLRLGQHLIAAGVPFISIFDRLIKRNGETATRFLMDEIHLNQSAMPLAVKALNQELHLGLQVPGHESYFIKNIVKTIRYKEKFFKETVKKKLLH
jgi:hypothetical protein